MKRFEIICTKQDGESGMFNDHFSGYRWKTGVNILTVASINTVRQALGGLNNGTGTRPATLMELLEHLGSPIGPLKEATVVPVQGSAVLPKTHPPAAKQAEDNKVLIARAEKERKRVEAERAEKFRIAEEQDGNALARESQGIEAAAAEKERRAALTVEERAAEDAAIAAEKEKAKAKKKKAPKVKKPKKPKKAEKKGGRK